MSLTIADLEGALTDRVEFVKLEDGRNCINELDSMKRSERTSC